MDLSYGVRALKKVSLVKLSTKRKTNFECCCCTHVPSKQNRSLLNRETTKIDALIQETQTSIELLKEHRTALISAAVTGKIDVREAA